MKLISMTAFVLEQAKKAHDGHITFNVVGLNSEKYAKFLKKPLSIGMLIPTDFEDNVMDRKAIFDKADEMMEKYKDNNDVVGYAPKTEFLKAEKRVLFIGAYIHEYPYLIAGTSHEIRLSDNVAIMCKTNGIWELNGSKTIEDLTEYNLDLTESAIKMIQ